MLELPLIFLSGLLGSAHCIGMCGPIALSLGTRAGGFRRNLSRQTVYSLGRIFTYASLGAAAGYGGWKMTATGETWTNVPATLAILAGVVLLYQGLSAMDRLPWRKNVGTAKGPCLAGSLFAPLLTLPGWSGVFLAGVFTGFMPCGLVYAFFAMAASSGSVWLGMATMAVFGLGTLPIMIGIGCGGSLLGNISREKVLRVAAACVLLSGAVCIARGIGFLRLDNEPIARRCPLCAPSASAQSTEF